MILQLRPVKFFRSPNLHQKPDWLIKEKRWQNQKLDRRMVPALPVNLVVKAAEIIRQKNRYSPPSGGDKFKEQI